MLAGCKENEGSLKFPGTCPVHSWQIFSGGFGSIYPAATGQQRGTQSSEKEERKKQKTFNLKYGTKSMLIVMGVID